MIGQFASALKGKNWCLAGRRLLLEVCPWSDCRAERGVLAACRSARHAIIAEHLAVATLLPVFRFADPRVMVEIRVEAVR